VSDTAAVIDSIFRSLDTLKASAPKSTVRAPDAIDAELQRQPRETAAKSLRDAPEMEALRQELVDAAIRQDAVLKMLGIVDQILRFAITGGL